MAGPFNKYRSLSVDESRGNPLYSWGAVHASRLGTYWTEPVDVPASELRTLEAVVQSKSRVKSVADARKRGIDLPPIELAVFRDGSAWIVDGNHRVVDAWQAGLPSLPAVFTFVGN